MNKTAVIILNYNGKELLRRFLPGVAEHSQGCDVCVADNGSSDGSVELVRNEFPSVRLIELDGNYGYAGGYNRAIAAVENEYVCLLNSDVEVAPGWTERPVEYLGQNPLCAGCQPKILSYADRGSFEFAGAAGGCIDSLGYPFCRGRVMDSIEKDCGQYDGESRVFWATGACLFMRRSDFIQAGGLDERFIAHQEEIDLCWRLSARGRYFAAIPGSVVYHVGAATLSRSDSRKTYLNFRNNLLMLYKNLPSASLAPTLVARFFMDYLALLVFALKGNFSDAAAVFRARRDYHKMKKSLRSDRLLNLRLATRRPCDCDGVYGGSMVFAYYVLGRRSYRQLMASSS